MTRAYYRSREGERELVISNEAGELMVIPLSRSQAMSIAAGIIKDELYELQKTSDFRTDFHSALIREL